jgi:hypothetical protein
VLRNYTMVSARGFSALVVLTSWPRLPKPAITQLPTHLVTVSPASTSLIHCTTPGSQTIHLPSLSYSYLGQPVGSSCQSYTVPVSPVGLVKITPESRTFQNIIYEPHVWGGRGSFSVAFLKSSYTILYV